VKFKLDENFPIELRDDLRSLGHDADSVPDEGIAGAPDEPVLERARAEGRVLLTIGQGHRRCSVLSTA
jgi:predicted nuclease of predicted toxin-antitoxin system